VALAAAAAQSALAAGRWFIDWLRCEASSTGGGGGSGIILEFHRSPKNAAPSNCCYFINQYLEVLHCVALHYINSRNVKPLTTLGPPMYSQPCSCLPSESDRCCTLTDVYCAIINDTTTKNTRRWRHLPCVSRCHGDRCCSREAEVQSCHVTNSQPLKPQTSANQLTPTWHGHTSMVEHTETGVLSHRHFITLRMFMCAIANETIRYGKYSHYYYYFFLCYR